MVWMTRGRVTGRIEGVAEGPPLAPEPDPAHVRDKVRKERGVEAAQVVLDHATADITHVYAERDLTLAAEVAAKIG